MVPPPSRSFPGRWPPIYLALPDEILDVLYKDGPQSQFDRLATEARSRLKFVGAIDNTSSGIWTITKLGRRIQAEQEVLELVRMKRTNSEFFQNTLGAKLRNPVWSWGAYNPDTNQLFLRVWEDDIDRSDEESSDRVLILGAHWKTKSSGLPERLRPERGSEPGQRYFPVKLMCSHPSGR